MGTFYVCNDVYTGACFWTEKRSRLSSIFSYDESYLSGNSNWNIDPALSMVSGAQAVKTGLLGAFLDAVPDRWGRMLIRHRYLRETKAKGSTPHTLNDVDYLLGVSDYARQGNLRFMLKRDGEFMHPAADCPKLIDLPKLLDATNRYTADKDINAINYLLDAGSASLGGARPKAAVSDNGELYIAKFPHRQDEWDVMAWEWVCLKAAADAGICVPECRLTKVDGQSVLLVKRFDRKKNKRIAYISAMTLLGLADGEQADYYEIAAKLRDVSTSLKTDLEEMFRRIAFSVTINNTDDHLRNHGFLRSGCGWRLSPIFDVNPNPDVAAVRSTSVFGEIQKEAALAALVKNADSFNLTQSDAEGILNEISLAVRSCGEYAKRTGIPKTEREMMLRMM